MAVAGAAVAGRVVAGAATLGRWVAPPPPAQATSSSTNDRTDVLIKAGFMYLSTADKLKPALTTGATHGRGEGRANATGDGRNPIRTLVRRSRGRAWRAA